MGGTSCDVCVIESGRVRRTDSRKIAGRVIQLPMVDVHTVGAGGGSVAWRDGGGVLRVGPRSAGAVPGPACYGRGGEEPTVTDADLMLGRLPAGGSIAGGVGLDPEAAERAIGALAARLGLEPLATAEGIVRVANQEMVRALRRVTVERGIDPREFALLPFGGAGPMHAAEIAAELGISRLICPRAGGTLSALGLCAADHRRDAAHTVMLRGPQITAARIEEEIAQLTAGPEAAEGAPGAAGEAPTVEVTYAVRYRGQSHELELGGEPGPGSRALREPRALREAFEAKHRRRYGYADPEAEIELVTIRVATVESGPPLSLAPLAPGTNATDDAGGEAGDLREVRFGGEWIEARVLRGDPAPGTELDGPAVFELPGSTLVLAPGWIAQVDEIGTVHCQRTIREGGHA